MGQIGFQDILAIQSVALFALGVLLAGGVFLFILGLRGRRVGQEPHCRKCGYDLRSLMGENCPECGRPASGRNVVIGVRHRRPRLWAPGLALLVLSLGGFGWIGYVRAKQVNWYTYLPTFALVHQARLDDEAAIDELVRRVKAGSLGIERLVELVPLALTRQGVTPKLRSIWSWTNLLAEVDIQDRLTPDQKEQFYDQILVIELECRPRVREDQEIRLSVVHCTYGAPGLRGWTSIEEEELRVGTWQQPVPLRSPGLSARGASVGVTCAVPPLSLQPGKYKVELRVTKFFGDLSVTRTFTLSRDLEVLAASAPDIVKLVKAPALAGQFRKALAIRSVSAASLGLPGDREPTWLEIDTVGPVPMDGAFRVLVRTAGREFEIGMFTLKKSQWQAGSSRQTSYPVQLTDVEFCVPILCDSADAAKTTTDIFEIWDGELVFDPVKVYHAPASAPAAASQATAPPPE